MSTAKENLPPSALPAKAAPPPPKKSQHNFPPPPPEIRDKKQNKTYNRGALLGEGGFARCYEVTDAISGRKWAAKVVPKASLKSQKQKHKLITEIKIHSQMKHANIVQFHHVFEDDENVYMILELCENKTVVDFLRKRRRLTEAEVRYYMKQVIEAVQHMHIHRVIHRDLKLGNFFLTTDMVLKIGDFGLAATIKHDGERKKTICGTPNYIAPEVLFDTQNGHSYEVDIWSLGVVLYTLCIGNPPFQTKDVKSIYRKIKDNNYEFPVAVNLSDEARSLIESLLNSKPECRPSISDILAHPFFSHDIPLRIPVSALQTTPLFESLIVADSKKTKLPVVGISTPSDEVEALSRLQNLNLGTQPKAIREVPPAVDNRTRYTPRQYGAFTRGRAEQVAQAKGSVEPLVEREVDAAKVKHNLTPVVPSIILMNTTSPSNPRTQVIERARTSNQLPVTIPYSPVCSHSLSSPSHKSLESAAYQYSPTPQRSAMPGPSVSESHFAATYASTHGVKRSKNVLESMYHVLQTAFVELKNSLGKTSPPLKMEDLREGQGRPIMPNVFISKWIDYSNKYGLGYQLTNGCIGVYFNDSTGIVVAADESNFEYLYHDGIGDRLRMHRRHHTMNSYPPELHKKVVLTTHFRQVMQKNLYKSSPHSFTDTEKITELDYLTKYLRTKHAVVFRLSNRVVQLNFLDHTKIILSSEAEVVTWVDRERNFTTNLLSHFLDEGNAEIVGRLKYAKNVLEQLLIKKQKREQDLVKN